MRIWQYSAGLILSMQLVACSDNAAPLKNDATSVLATVNGEAITEMQFEISLLDMFGEQQVAQMNAAGKEKALEGIVSSRAIAQHAWQELDEEARLSIEYQTRIYRERLLLNEYLTQHAKPKPISNQMIEQYYANHQNEFGGGDKREYEMFITKRKVSDKLRDTIIRRLGAIKDQGKDLNWSNYIRQLQQENLPIEYRVGIINADVLSANIVQLGQQLAEHEISDVAFMAGKPFILRVTRIEQQQAQPLHAVAAEIRRRLAPAQLKDSIKQLNEQILAQSKIEYMTEK